MAGASRQRWCPTAASMRSPSLPARRAVSHDTMMLVALQRSVGSEVTVLPSKARFRYRGHAAGLHALTARLALSPPLTWWCKALKADSRLS